MIQWNDTKCSLLVEIVQSQPLKVTGSSLRLSFHQSSLVSTESFSQKMCETSTSVKCLFQYDKMILLKTKHDSSRPSNFSCSISCNIAKARLHCADVAHELITALKVILSKPTLKSMGMSKFHRYCEWCKMLFIVRMYQRYPIQWQQCYPSYRLWNQILKRFSFSFFDVFWI